jgi:hypothetical protein
MFQRNCGKCSCVICVHRYHFRISSERDQFYEVVIKRIKLQWFPAKKSPTRRWKFASCTTIHSSSRMRKMKWNSDHSMKAFYWMQWFQCLSSVLIVRPLEMPITNIARLKSKNGLGTNRGELAHKSVFSLWNSFRQPWNSLHPYCNEKRRVSLCILCIHGRSHKRSRCETYGFGVCLWRQSKPSRAGLHSIVDCWFLRLRCMPGWGHLPDASALRSSPISELVSHHPLCKYGTTNVVPMPLHSHIPNDRQVRLQA